MFKLQTPLRKQQDIFKKAVKMSDETVGTSFIVSELIAKYFKPFTDDLFVNKCPLKVADAACPSMKILTKYASCQAQFPRELMG